jgi:hypothetical protein
MGVLGSQIGALAGGSLGETLGKKIAGETGGKIGKAVGTYGGEALGSAFPYFKKGGMVHETGPAVVHKGELVVPRKYVKDVPKSIKNAIKADNKPKPKPKPKAKKTGKGKKDKK